MRFVLVALVLTQALAAASHVNVTVRGNVKPPPTTVNPCYPTRAVNSMWKLNGKSVQGCQKTADHGDRKWIMLRAYRAGGKKGTDWKFSDRKIHKGCMTDWKYYKSDGTTLIENVQSATTMTGESDWWCALPVYRDGGVRGYEWEYCSC